MLPYKRLSRLVWNGDLEKADFLPFAKTPLVIFTNFLMTDLAQQNTFTSAFGSKLPAKTLRILNASKVIGCSGAPVVAMPHPRHTRS